MRRRLARLFARLYYRFAGPLAPANPEDGHVTMTHAPSGLILKGRNGAVLLNKEQSDRFASELAYYGESTFVVNDGCVSR